VHTPEGFRPPRFLFSLHEVGWSDKGVVKMGDGGDVPGVASQAAGEEGVGVVEKVAMIISTSSRGSLVAGDGRVVEVP
jgi:hypothetical protein